MSETIEPSTEKTENQREHSEKNKDSKKRSYIPVQALKRDKLIQLVTRDCITIKDAAAKLDINYSTAKHIIKTHSKSCSKRQALVHEALLHENLQESINCNLKRLAQIPVETLEKEAKDFVSPTRSFLFCQDRASLNTTIHPVVGQSNCPSTNQRL